MHISAKRTLVATATAGFLFISLTGTAFAWGDRDRDDSRDDQRGEAASYINPDTGAATENGDVDPNSNCFRPDQHDQQRFSDPGTANRNVHNDACFLGRDGKKLDGPASFQSSGVGTISACPDPDGAGPKVAVLSDANRDGRADLCFQSGYQEKGTAGDLEFHARFNNTGMAGTQYVTWCSDSDRNGCDDEWNHSSIRIDWSADGTATFRDDDRNRYSDGDRYSWSR